MRVAVTGSSGRLGRALVHALEDAPFTGPRGPLAWTRAELDLDAPEGVAAALDRDKPEVVVHAAAWTDVDGCARDPDARHAPQRPRRPVSSRRPASPAAWSSSSSRPTKSSMAPGPTGAATRPATSPRRPTRTVPASWPVSAPRSMPSATPPGRRWASPGRAGCSVHPATTSRTRSWTRRRGPRRPASRCGSWPTSGGARPRPPTWPRPSSSCSPRTPTQDCTTWSTAVSRPGPSGPPRSCAWPASSARGAGPCQHLDARLHPAALGRAGADADADRRADAAVAAGPRRPGRGPPSRRRRRPAQRCGDPPRPPPAAAVDRPRATRLQHRGRALRRDRPARRRARRLPRAVARERPRAGAPTADGPAPTRPTSRPTCRARAPASCAACTSIDASRTTGWSPRVAPSWPSSMSARCWPTRSPAGPSSRPASWPRTSGSTSPSASPTGSWP